jgi:hypothetical protein
MRKLLFLCCVLLLPSAMRAQVAPPAAASSAQTKTDLRTALLGDWVGVLEYRDYSQPATSTKREVLPTWLSISDAEAGKTLSWHYVYDDGPTKVVEETDIVNFDPAGSAYSESDNGKAVTTFVVAGYDTLRSGRGTLVLTGAGTDNDKPSQTRITMLVGRNLLTILEETRPAGSNDSFVFRHAFRFTRATAPHPGH